MTNKDMFDICNHGAYDKASVREEFLNWCEKNGRAPTNPQTLQNWFKLPWKGVIKV